MKYNGVIPYTKPVFFPFLEYITICICIFLYCFGGDFKNSSQTNCDILVHIFLAVQNLCQNKNNHHFVVFNKATVVGIYISTSPCF